MAAWLADLAWPAVVGVMALALAIAWLVEWVSWRDAQARAAAPRLDQRQVVEEPQALPEPAPEPESEPSPVVETVPDPVAIESDPEPLPVPPEAVSAPQPMAPEPEPVEVAALEPMAPEPVEAVPEPESDERRSEPQPDEEPESETSDAPAPRARRAWHGMSFRRVDPREASTPEEPPVPAESESVEAPELAPIAASEPEPPVEIAPPPEPEARPAYAPPRAVPRLPPSEAAPVARRVAANVVRMPQSAHPREWNVWELESLARGQARLEPERGEEWSYLFVHLRQFADARGKLPSEFDGLVRESFGELLETLEPA